MILIINICKNEMHYYEFVKPVEDILIKNEVSFDTVHYSKITSSNAKKLVNNYHRFIICGTSLKDMSYSEKQNISKFRTLFKQISESGKPLLGICGGMQLLCMVNGCLLEKNYEIGSMKINFTQEFLGIKGTREVYSLHNMGIKNDEIVRKNFNIYSMSKTSCIQAVKSKKYKHYGVLFHPEVRNKDLIVNFLYA